MGQSGILKPDMNHCRVGAIIVAAGESQRMVGIDKVFAPVLGRPLLAHTIAPFEECDLIDDVVIVLTPDNISEGMSLKEKEGWQKISSICPGGKRRQDSVLAGLERLSSCRWVIIHDGARPCLDTNIIKSGLEAVEDTGAAVPAMPATDTIKIVSPDGLVESTPTRDSLWLVQTPQVFLYDILLTAHRSTKKYFTDDAALVESAGCPVKIFPGLAQNIKVTTPADLLLVENFFVRDDVVH